MLRFILSIMCAMSLFFSSCAIFVCDTDDSPDDDDSITVIFHQSPVGPNR